MSNTTRIIEGSTKNTFLEGEFIYTGENPKTFNGVINLKNILCISENPDGKALIWLEATQCWRMNELYSVVIEKLTIKYDNTGTEI